MNISKLINEALTETYNKEDYIEQNICSYVNDLLKSKHGDKYICFILDSDETYFTLGFKSYFDTKPTPDVLFEFIINKRPVIKYYIKESQLDSEEEVLGLSDSNNIEEKVSAYAYNKFEYLLK